MVSCPSSDLLSSSWACLPDDLLNSILDRLDPCDYIRLSVVCKSWNLIYLRHRKESRIRNSNHQLPWLLKRTCHGHKKLFNYATGAEISCKLSIPYQYKHLVRCGCSHGRLIFFMEHKSQLVVLNPFSAAGGTDVIRLPPFSNSLFKYVDKVILSRDPSLGSNFEVVATCRYTDVVAHLVYVDDHDHQLNWTYSEKTRDYYTYNFAFYKDRILGVSPKGQIVSLNVINSSKEKDSSSSSPPRISIEEITSSIEWMSHSDSFIVETTNGELLMVGRSRKFHKMLTFKMMDSNGQLDLRLVVDLGGHSLFLEKHHSLSVMASNYPGSCRPNTIYYVGVRGLQFYGRFEEFNLDDQSLHVDVERFSMPEGSWIVPSMKP